LASVYPHALWAGDAVDGLRLVLIVRDELTSRYFGGKIERGFGVRVTYVRMGAASAGATARRASTSRSAPGTSPFESKSPSARLRSRRLASS